MKNKYAGRNSKPVTVQLRANKIIYWNEVNDEHSLKRNDKNVCHEIVCCAAVERSARRQSLIFVRIEINVISNSYKLLK